MIRSPWAFSSLGWINPIVSTLLHMSSSPTSDHLGGPPLSVFQFFSFSSTGGNQHWVLPTSCLPSLKSSTGPFFWAWKCHLHLNPGRDKIDPPFLPFLPFLYSYLSLLEYFGVCFDLYFITYSMGTSCRKYLQIRNKEKCILPYFY